jgi:predicted DNA-binding protein
MKTICLKIPLSLDGRLSAMATKRMKTRSEVSREAIELFLSATGEEDDHSFLAQARDLAGIVDGPNDLSCNPTHLEGYGI